GATALQYSEATNRLSFFRVAYGSAGHSKNVQIADFNLMSVRSTPNRMKNFFDNISGASFSPNGGAILASKEDSSTYELFRVSDLHRITLPTAIRRIEFSGDSEMLIELKNGSSLRWSIP